MFLKLTREKSENSWYRQVLTKHHGQRLSAVSVAFMERLGKFLLPLKPP